MKLHERYLHFRSLTKESHLSYTGEWEQKERTFFDGCGSKIAVL